MSQDRSEITRRDVLRGAGVAALLGAVAPMAKGEAKKGMPGVNVLGPDAAPIKLDVNGKAYTVLAEPRLTLLDALRDHAGLTGTKRICDGGACGGCTVMVDGKTVNSCLMLAVEARGKQIRTIEGLEQNGKLHPVQEAFIQHDALQCGFCTPGMIMSCTALVEANAEPGDEQIKEAVAGNLCRCGTYPHVFEACRTAAQSMREAKK
ncbi:MAG: (2Fe-2S)-binding protein [Planctomycetota bacterium]|jgi:aerobic-type carbon monoxide dehydrogenase small subunit (CoxS/CutS family)